MDKNISATIITYNEEDNIENCLLSIENCVDEIIVVDSYSTDRTKEICQQHKNVRFLEHTFLNYSEQKQFATDQASNEWILSIDADERLTPSLEDEIKSLELNDGNISAYYINRKTAYLGKVLKHGGIATEKILRLFNKKRGHFADVKVHEYVETNGKSENLKGYIVHDPYKNLSHHLGKIDKYTTLWAADRYERGEHCSGLKVLSKGACRLGIMMIKMAFLDGYPGMVWSLMSAYYAFLKYAKLHEMCSHFRNEKR